MTPERLAEIKKMRDSVYFNIKSKVALGEMIEAYEEAQKEIKRINDIIDRLEEDR